MTGPTVDAQKKSITKADFEFVRKTPLFEAIPKTARLHLYYAVQPVKVKAGERFIRQGDEGATFYIIRDGQCAVKVEKDGVLHKVAVLGEGQTVGEMAIVTGECRQAHVDAVTDMELWGFDKTAFEDLCTDHPEITHFITEIVTRRLDTARITGERTIGKYTINEIIAKGGAAIVYKGMHSLLNLPVAIKMLKHKLAMDQHFFEQIQKEAKVIAGLYHENIVKVYDIEHLYRTIFIIMEYLDGVTLEDLLRANHRLSPEDALAIILQVCAGLGYAHRRGIVHRDIKPPNIIIQADDRVKILDFGLAARPGTVHSEFEGTPHYASPDQILLGAVDERSDIYSLGITCFRMLTGENPFKDLDPRTVLRMHLKEKLPDPRLHVSDLPEEFCIFLKKATQKDPSQRYQSVDEITRELEPLSNRLGVVSAVRSVPKSSTINLSLSYQQQHEAEVRRLLKDLEAELRKLGIDLRELD